LEKIKQFEESNYLNCNSKDYSKVFSHRKTNEVKQKVSGSFYQNIENPLSSRSDGKGLLKFHNKKNDDKNCNNSEIIDNTKKNFHSDLALDLKNIKTGNFTLKNENEVNQAKERSRRNTIFSNASRGDLSNKDKEAFSHRKTRSLNLDNRDLYLVKKESKRSNQSDTRVNNGGCCCDDDLNNVWKISKMLKSVKQIKIKDESKAYKDNNIEELKKKINKAAFLDTSKYIKAFIALNNYFHICLFG